MDINKNKLHYSGCVSSVGCIISGVSRGLAVVLPWGSQGGEGAKGGLGSQCCQHTGLPSWTKGLQWAHCPWGGLQPAGGTLGTFSDSPGRTGPVLGVKGDGIGTTILSLSSSPYLSPHTSNLWAP